MHRVALFLLVKPAGGMILSLLWLQTTALSVGNETMMLGNSCPSKGIVARFFLGNLALQVELQWAGRSSWQLNVWLAVQLHSLKVGLFDISIHLYAQLRGQLGLRSSYFAPDFSKMQVSNSLGVGGVHVWAPRRE